MESRLLGALAWWAGASTVVGAVLAVVGWRARRRAVAGFGLQSVVWGAVDRARLRTSTPAVLRGHGAAVVVQGGYLLVADVLAAAALPRP